MIYLILFLISFSLTYFIKNYMIKKSLVATVNERSSHTVPTPHGGGIALVITWFIGLMYLYFIGEISSNLFYALLFGAVISIVSFFDDIYELSPKIRLIAQSIVAIGGLYFLGGFETLTFGIFDIQNPIFTNIFAFFMIIWFINLYNFLDGINGYAGSEAVFLALAGFVLFGGNHFLVLAVAVLGFLYWNWNKAKIFMGDVGSLALGGILGTVATITKQEFLLVIVGGIFVMEALSVILQVGYFKMSGGKRIFLMAPFHHHFEKKGWPESKVVIRFWIISIILGLIALATLKLR